MADKNIKVAGKNGFNIGFILAGLIALGIFIILASYMLKSCNDNSQVLSINERLDRMEKSLSGIDAINDRLSSLDRQSTEFQIAMTERINRLESSMSQKIGSSKTVSDDSRSEAIRIDKKPAALLQIPVDSKAKEETVKYHQVKNGETLYGISLRYGLTVDELNRLNNLDSGSVIHVGQKLKVSE
jgi:LysM repeat protein